MADKRGAAVFGAARPPFGQKWAASERALQWVWGTASESKEGCHFSGSFKTISERERKATYLDFQVRVGSREGLFR